MISAIILGLLAGIFAIGLIEFSKSIRNLVIVLIRRIKR